MDAVITYVNSMDPLWQRDYAQYAREEINEKRFRDWGTLRYLLRGIQVNMPFIENVFLVVSRESQVPEWADRSKLRIVLHGDIIPERFLPVFNSGSIEMFLHRIPGLSEEFIYMNDDFFPMRKCSPEFFFKDGKLAASFHRHLFASGIYKYHCKISDVLARKAAGLRPRLSYIRPQHTCSAMLRSCCEELYAKEEQAILSAVPRLRRKDNYNYYLFTDYAKYCGRTFGRRVSNKHFSTAVSSMDSVCSFIASPTHDFACINDVNMDPDRYAQFRERLLDAFEKAFPSRSRFELPTD